MRLDSLHDVRKEPLTLRNETILPHFVGDQANKVSREQDLLDMRRVVETGGGDLQATNETIKNILVQMSNVLHETNLLLSGIIVNIRQPVGCTESRKTIFAIVCDRDGTRIGCLTSLSHDHKLISRGPVINRAERVDTSGRVSSLMTTGSNSGCTITVSHTISVGDPETWSKGR